MGVAEADAGLWSEMSDELLDELYKIVELKEFYRKGVKNGA